MAKTIRDEDFILNIIVKGEKGISAIDKITADTARLKMTMNELQKHIKLTKTALANAVPGTENWKHLNNELRESRARMKELQDQSKATGGALQSLSKIKAGAVAALAAVSGAIRGAGKAIGTIADFEQANANLSTIIGKNINDIQGLTESAKKLGSTTEYTASQVTFLQTELAKLGFKEADILNMEESVLHFATAVGADLSESASLAGATLRMFGLDSTKTEDTLGVLTKATTNSALSFSYLQTAMSIVGPVAKTFGFSVRDTSALLGTLANSGFDASSAATATRNILLKLADANGDLAVALGRPVKTLPDLVSGLKELNSRGIDLAGTLELTDKRSVSAFNAFLRGADDVDTLRESLDDVKGVLGDTAEARMNTVNGSIKLLQSAWEGFILSLSNSKGVIKWAIDAATKLVGSLTDFVQGPGAKLMEMARENGQLDLSGDYYQNMSSENKQAVKKVFERELKEAEDTYNNLLEQWESRSGLRKFFSQSSDLKVALDEAAAEVEFQKTRLNSFLPIFSQPEDNAENENGNGNGNKDRDKPCKKVKKCSEEVSDARKEAEKIMDEIMKEYFENLEKAQKLEKEGLDILIAAETDKTKAAMANENKRYREQLKKYKDTEIEYENKTEVIEALEKQHQINLAKIRQEAFERELNDLEQKHNREKQEIQNDYLKELADKGGNDWQAAAIKKAMQEAGVRADLSYMKELEKRLRDVVESGAINGVKIPEEELKKIKLKLEQTIGKVAELTAQDKANGAGIWGGTGGGSLFGVSEEQWGRFFYNLENSKMKAEDLVNLLGGLGNVANEGFQLASKAIANTNAKEQEAFRQYQKHQEEEKKALQTRLDSGLMSQAQYDAETQRMEAEAEAKQEAMKLKQAKREKSMNLIQAIINTALGVTKTLAQWGIPAGIAPAAIMSAMGAAQVALIAAQPVTGAEEGGFVNTRREQDGKRFKARLSPDKRGFISSPTVLVGENGGEYVIPSSGLDNPTLRPLLATIETARKAGRLKDLNFEAVYPVTSSFGRESGGYVRSDTRESTPNVVTVESSRDSQRLAEAIEQLNKRLSKPIKADVSMTGRNGIIEKTEEYNRAKNRGRYNG